LHPTATSTQAPSSLSPIPRAATGASRRSPTARRAYTTIELKTNFLGTALSGTLTCESNRIHGGRTTQVWDAAVKDESGKTLALFRCTQLLLY
jgi:uncharacterized protein (TIGR00369 family)